MSHCQSNITTYICIYQLTNKQKVEIMNIAQEILIQLGGNKFRVMTGSSQFTSGKNSLSMKLIRNNSGANYLRITLTPMDVYKMEFISIRGESMKTKREFEEVYFDQLQSIFTEVTGLYTKLY